MVGIDLLVLRRCLLNITCGAGFFQANILTHHVQITPLYIQEWIPLRRPILDDGWLHHGPGGGMEEGLPTCVVETIEPTHY